MKARLILPLALLALSLAPLAAHAQTDRVIGEEPLELNRVITVSGEATERIPATRARLSAMIEVQAATPTDAQNAVRARSQQVLDFLQRARVDELQAGTMSLHPVYGEARSIAGSTAPTGPEIVGYRAQWRANFETAADRAGEIVDGVVRSGAARIASFEFTATEAEIADARQRALGNAALKARADASAVLQSLGYRAGEVVRVDVDGSGPIMPMHRGMETMAFASASADEMPTAVSPGLIDVRANVRLAIEY